MVKLNTIYRTRSDIIFYICNILFMILFMIIMIYPMYFSIIASFSDINEVGAGNVYIIPRGFTLDAYKNVFINDQIWVGYRNTIFYTVCGMLYSLAIMIPVAYSLSKKELFGRNIVTWYFLVTMYFSGGMVPTYILIKSLGLLNTPWVMIVGSLSVYNMIVTRTYFSKSIPEEIYQSARIDGANELRCFFGIALPLSAPIIAVMALYFAVSIWNSYFGALIYITEKKLYPLQLVLRNILILNQTMLTDPEYFSSLSVDEQNLLIKKAHLAQSMKYSVIFIASAPLLMAYPFVQKHFIKGIMIGALKA